RFFLLLLIGLVWLGPAWADRRYLYAMAVWDVLVLCGWGLDLARLPKREQLEVRRIWATTLQLPGESNVTIELLNRGGCDVASEIQDDVPLALRGEIPQLEISAPHGGKGTAKYMVCPRERGDAVFGEITMRYQGPARLAERWAGFAT